MIIIKIGDRVIDKVDGMVGTVIGEIKDHGILYAVDVEWDYKNVFSTVPIDSIRVLEKECTFSRFLPIEHSDPAWF
jgi:hypothetical protein